MDDKVKGALDTALSCWNAMARADIDQAEAAANQFEASFYNFIDAVREWVNGLELRPETLEELFKLPMILTIAELLPAPLYLNFETEAELIVENKTRMDEDKYD